WQIDRNSLTQKPGRRDSRRPGSVFVLRSLCYCQLLGVLHELQLEVDLDLVGDNGITGTEGGLEAHAVGLAADGCRRGEARARPAVGVYGLAKEFDGQLDRLGRATDRQGAVENELVAVLALQSGGDEGEGGVVLD